MSVDSSYRTGTIEKVSMYKGGTWYQVPIEKYGMHVVTVRDTSEKKAIRKANKLIRRWNYQC